MLLRNFLQSALLLAFAAGFGPRQSPAAEASAAVLAGGLKNPRALTVMDDGRIFVTSAGELGKDGDGSVLLIQDGKAAPFATGLDDPQGIASFRSSLYVADKRGVWKIDAAGKATVLAAADVFPSKPKNLSSIAVEYEKGTIFVGDLGDENGQRSAVYRIGEAGTVDAIIDSEKNAAFGTPNGLLLDGAAYLLVADSKKQALTRVRIVDGGIEMLNAHLGDVQSLTWDIFGRLYLGLGGPGARCLVIPRPNMEPVPLPSSGPLRAVGVDRTAGQLLVLGDDNLRTIPIVIAGAEVDQTRLPLEAVSAFPKLQWTGWSGESPDGKIQHFRPIVLTHAGDGSNRVFVATQHGVIHVFPNDQNAAKTEIFLDIQDHVRYNDKTDEEGFLGLAFHPRYKETGEFFVFYTPKKASRRHTNVVSRFRVRRDNPNQADPASEEVILTIEHPFWNHDGGTVAFGPDGNLYIALGDGGAANDPFRNGQNLGTLLGKILRIDVDHREGDKKYAIPKDNPFVGRNDARPEIWCYGLRNVWRFSFDRDTGTCWASDVGQDLWEEIDLLVPGGNYGWNLREGLHPFGPRGVGPRKELIDPIWEYHHSAGKSVTGGSIYRGKLLPELAGAYLYADYVAGTVFALRYDPAKQRVVANQPIRTQKLPIVSFGEDQSGEMYFLSVTADGRGISRFARQGVARRAGPCTQVPLAGGVR